MGEDTAGKSVCVGGCPIRVGQYRDDGESMSEQSVEPKKSSRGNRGGEFGND
jgi:hypothetical protein